MIIDKIAISSKTGEKIIEQIEIPDINEYIPQHEPTLEEKIELLEDENKKIKEVNNTQDILIDTTMLATDEIFTMIEPILELVPQTISLERSTSKMVDMYVCMIQRGLKTIEQIPIRYREEVKRILTELEK